jgi:hypothetical protein
MATFGTHSYMNWGSERVTILQITAGDTSYAAPTLIPKALIGVVGAPKLVYADGPFVGATPAMGVKWDYVVGGLRFYTPLTGAEVAAGVNLSAYYGVIVWVGA